MCQQMVSVYHVTIFQLCIERETCHRGAIFAPSRTNLSPFLFLVVGQMLYSEKKIASLYSPNSMNEWYLFWFATIVIFAKSRGMLNMEADTNKGVKSEGLKMFGLFPRHKMEPIEVTQLDKSLWVALRYVLSASQQSNPLFLLQVSGNMGKLCLCNAKDQWLVLLNLVCMNTSSDGCFSSWPRGLENVCLFANFYGRKEYQHLLQAT